MQCRLQLHVGFPLLAIHTPDTSITDRRRRHDVCGLHSKFNRFISSLSSRSVPETPTEAFLAPHRNPIMCTSTKNGTAGILSHTHTHISSQKTAVGTAAMKQTHCIAGVERTRGDAAHHGAACLVVEVETSFSLFTPAFHCLLLVTFSLHVGQNPPKIRVLWPFFLSHCLVVQWPASLRSAIGRRTPVDHRTE